MHEQLTLDELSLPSYAIGEEVYFIYRNENTIAPAKGRVISYMRMDSLNTQYLVQGKTFSKWLFDTKIYGSLEELIKDFESVLII